MQSAVQVWRKQQIDKTRLSQEGVILSWTEIAVAPPRFESQLPYTIILVELATGNRMYGQLVDFVEKDREIGAHVISVFRRMGDVGATDVIEYGIKFKPYKSSKSSR